MTVCDHFVMICKEEAGAGLATVAQGVGEEDKQVKDGEKRRK